MYTSLSLTPDSHPSQVHNCDTEQPAGVLCIQDITSQLCNPKLRKSGSFALKANLPNIYLGGKPCLYYTGQQRIYLLCSGGRYELCCPRLFTLQTSGEKTSRASVCKDVQKCKWPWQFSFSLKTCKRIQARGTGQVTVGELVLTWEQPFIQWLVARMFVGSGRGTESIRNSLHAQSRLTLCNPMACCAPGSSVHGILQVRILEWAPFPYPGDLPFPGIRPASPVSPALQADSLPTRHLGTSIESVALFFFHGRASVGKITMVTATLSQDELCPRPFVSIMHFSHF